MDKQVYRLLNLLLGNMRIMPDKAQLWGAMCKVTSKNVCNKAYTEK